MRRLRDEKDASEEFNSTSIFVTPMLDMSFQLMAFFIFTYNPSLLEGQFPISLAAGEAGGPAEARPDQVASPRATPTKPAVTVRARAAAKGKLASLEIVSGGRSEIIKGAEGKEDEPITNLLAQLESRLLQYRGDDDRLTLQGSIGLRWEDSMMVMDSCRQTSQLFQLKKDGTLQQLYPHIKMGEKPIRLFPKIEMDTLRVGPGSGAAAPAGAAATPPDGG